MTMTGPSITPAHLRFVDDGELLALMAGTCALRVRTPEDCELLDAIGREFRDRKSPEDPDDPRCARCGMYLSDHDFDTACPWVDEPRAFAVTPHIFGQDAA